ncbi:MAG: peptide deformylase [Deltaproteobacteria bacterium]|nr:peptide deformylase [Deltaproteobacteria bacterium]
MAPLPIRLYPDPLLKKVAQEVAQWDSSLQCLINDMIETLYHSPGVALAAPQVGHSICLTAIDVSRSPRAGENHGLIILINPRIIQWEGEHRFREGCLSVPEFLTNSVRAEKVRVKALNRNGIPQEFHCEGLEAIAVQHEIDHFEGKLILDHVRSPRDLFRRKER